jgi:hypothetical protein
VETPEDLSPEARAALERFGALASSGQARYPRRDAFAGKIQADGRAAPAPKDGPDA